MPQLIAYHSINPRCDACGTPTPILRSLGYHTMKAPATAMLCDDCHPEPPTIPTEAESWIEELRRTR